MTDDLLSLLRMVDVILHAFDEVTVVVLDEYIVVVGDEHALPVPRFVFGQRRDGQRIGRHDPFEVRCHIIALNAEDELVLELFVMRHESLDPLGVIRIIILVGLAEVAHRMIEILLEEQGALWLLANAVAAYGEVLLLVERQLVIHPLEVTEGIQLEDDRIGHFLDWTRLDKEGIGILADDVAIEIRHAVIAGEIADGLIEVDEIATVAVLVEPWELEVTQIDKLGHLAFTVGILGRECGITLEAAVVSDSILDDFLFGKGKRVHQALYAVAMDEFGCEIVDKAIEIIGDSWPSFTCLAHV